MNPSRLVQCAGAALAIIVLVIPLAGSASLTDLMFRTCLLAIIAISWNMMATSGLISLGHSAFWGMGAYAAILLANRFSIGFIPSLLGAMVIGALLGAGLALITGRLQGIYFAVCTLAMSEGLRVGAVMLVGVTGGAQGQYLDSALAPSPWLIDMVASVGAVGAALLAFGISRTRYQYAFRAMRANERAAQMLGIRPLIYRVAIVALSGGLASFAGAASMWYGGYLDPSVAFNLQTTLIAQIAPILGGITTLSGPLLGTLLVTLLSEGSRAAMGSVEGATLLIYGVALVLCVIYLPQGFRGAIQSTWRRRRRSRSSSPVSTEAVAKEPA